MSTLSRPLCTLQAVKDELGFKPVDNSKDDKLIRALNLASAAVEEELGTDFGFHDHSETVYYPNGDMLFDTELILPWPIITLTNIFVSETALQEDGVWYVEQNRSHAYSIRGRIRFAATLSQTAGRQVVSVEGTFGYVQTDSGQGVPVGVPAMIQRATAITAARWSGEFRRDVSGADGNRLSIATSELPKEVEMMLDRFKLPIL